MKNNCLLFSVSTKEFNKTGLVLIGIISAKQNQVTAPPPQTQKVSARFWILMCTKFKMCFRNLLVEEYHLIFRYKF